MIHTGHWAEFHVPGMLAEGLALASTTSPNSTHRFRPDFFDYGAQQPESSARSIVDHAATALRNISLNNPRSSSPSAYTGGSHSLDILHRMLQDPSLAAGKTCTQGSVDGFSDTLQAAGDKIREYVKMWQVDSEKEVPENFSSQSALLRAQVSVILGWWVSRGRPAIPISDYYSREFDPSLLIPKVLQVHPDKSAVGIGKDKTTNLPSNMWLAIIESSLNHPQEHLLKTQRALAHFDRLAKHLKGISRALRNWKEQSFWTVRSSGALPFILKRLSGGSGKGNLKEALTGLGWAGIISGSKQQERV
ncbi:hypothetical protein FRC05_010604 [Tulasnella sp. 425]|nr:hypothetical protein FRC05_010604 [Tulasnella sp. 425]